MDTRDTASGCVFHLLTPANKTQVATADGRSAGRLKSTLSDGGRRRESDSAGFRLSSEHWKLVMAVLLSAD